MTTAGIDITATGVEAAVCIYSSDAREIVRITASGQVVVNPEFTVDEAARAFWDAVQKLAGRARIGGPDDDNVPLPPAYRGKA